VADVASGGHNALGWVGRPLCMAQRTAAAAASARLAMQATAVETHFMATFVD